LAVVVADVEVEGDFHFERLKVGTSPVQLRALSGMSGGPCFRLIPAENRIELSAIIYEGRWDIGIVFARPTALISDEGVVAAAPPGVNRPEPDGD